MRRDQGVVTIAAVAREAGGSAALIHNRYPDVAEAIRALACKNKRDQVATLTAAPERERADAGDLRTENTQLLAELRASASVNESLRRELAIEKAKSAGRVVSPCVQLGQRGQAAPVPGAASPRHGH